MFDLTILDLSSAAGLTATGFLTFNILLGMLLSTAYKTTKIWKSLPKNIQKIRVYQLHNITAYVALTLVIIHPLLLLLDISTQFTFIDIIFPLHAPKQKLFVALGTLSLYALISVVITSQKVVKKRMSFRLWKNIHLISYLTAILFVIHGVAMDPLLKDRAIDYLDAEKLFPELCLIAIIVATLFRYRYHLKKKKAL
ncbi:MAG: ferric reductase-like transmembrane domain-containing protein [Bacteroidetes bacterium]|nr:ferric reductase-like transmembrane domain-containing protein [Bacteroidota bacterium]MBU1373761.1 ferric reductase-like transmembrane domain-containing protein [Bacteroidota bacterium]MBU1486155.1 ferric reductase-like transmembrane domain-containing protein [Bacteroidota bacterium]MBU1761799.1 ferric reductase-like transmembrane domain-containing protein [Bacteroidota bacterium]MBU2267511.1 ferric reductase-like transmembrane domain-containing protein [Bacteroidota bacterium]